MIELKPYYKGVYDMPEKRNLSRIKKRLPIKIGTETPDRVAFTEDLSFNGIFVKTVSPLPPGTRLKIQLTMPDGTTVLMEGMSRWRKSVPAQVIHLANKKGMGIKILKFISGEEIYTGFLASAFRDLSPAKKPEISHPSLSL
jgi:hypothetical protein